jgi:LPXTG-site transpeptidase (sortase) family protein
MKRLKKRAAAFIAAALALIIGAGLCAPSYAYNYDFESGGETLSGFGKSTSSDAPPAKDPMSVNARRNKDAAALPPPYGIFSGDIPTDQSSLYHDNDTATYYPAEGASTGGASGGASAGAVDSSGGAMLPPTSVYTPSPTPTPNLPSENAAPTLAAGTGTRPGASSATVQFYSNKSGRYYYTIVNDGAAVPSISTSGLGISCASGWTTLEVTVTTGAKDFYVRLKDANGSVSAALKIDIPAYATPTYTAPSYYADGSIGTLYVPRAEKNLKVYEGETLENMQKGIGHFVSTSAWDGNVGFAGHNRGAAAYFSFVKNLATGDRLIYTTPYGTRTYEIYRKDIISETDFSSLYSGDGNILTLITCVENVPEQRYCVQAREI